MPDRRTTPTMDNGNEFFVGAPCQLPHYFSLAILHSFFVAFSQFCLPYASLKILAIFCCAFSPHLVRCKKFSQRERRSPNKLQLLRSARLSILNSRFSGFADSYTRFSPLRSRDITFFAILHSVPFLSFFCFCHDLLLVFFSQAAAAGSSIFSSVQFCTSSQAVQAVSSGVRYSIFSSQHRLRNIVQKPETETENRNSDFFATHTSLWRGCS